MYSTSAPQCFDGAQQTQRDGPLRCRLPFFKARNLLTCLVELWRRHRRAVRLVYGSLRGPLKLSLRKFARLPWGYVASGDGGVRRRLDLSAGPDRLTSLIP
jgi:hypothetical protein